MNKKKKRVCLLQIASQVLRLFQTCLPYTPGLESKPERRLDGQAGRPAAVSRPGIGAGWSQSSTGPHYPSHRSHVIGY